MTITGKVKLHYFAKLDVSKIGRRGPVQFLLEDAGIPYELYLHQIGEWFAQKAELVASDRTPYAVLPCIELEGKVHVQSQPILRLLSQRLGKYAGNNAEEAHLVDTFSDMANDWFGAWGRTVFESDEVHNKKYVDVLLPGYLDAAERFLSLNKQGPYLLGEELSYGDFILASVVNDNGNLQLDGHPHVKAAVEAIFAKPYAKTVLSSDDKLLLPYNAARK
ncbi:hypothetical protein THASP1DRAFT_18704 [Thamnocephalis sphaerospora]|uniref:Glutathione S-transferase n=1 Tax=Thamnocephalis sphaerospora TaxID=78915 RepID=A0A4P9XKG2_9FUNG|nr:hypothetical protein THASP1DRAFT_18704 [Thamnocephalis sphaerospora]|eukprot:RKP06246.1 hypothetical protein THASP1DRAFT_18704 [Thamnocephalis sphaerospora]